MVQRCTIPPQKNPLSLLRACCDFADGQLVSVAAFQFAWQPSKKCGGNVAAFQVIPADERGSALKESSQITELHGRPTAGTR
jgi:hypothetical protein